MNLKTVHISDWIFELFHPLLWLPAGFLILWFTYEIIQKRKDEVFYSILFFMILIMIIQPFTHAVQGHIYESFIGRDLKPETYFNPVLLVIILLPILYSIILLKQYLSKLKSLFLRKQVATIYYTYMFILSLVIAFEIILPNLIGIKNVPNLTPVIIPYITLIIFFSLSRYEFLLKDSDVILNRIFSIVKKGLILTDNRNNIIKTNELAEDFLLTRPDLIDEILKKREKRSFLLVKEEPYIFIEYTVIEINGSYQENGRLFVFDDISEDYIKQNGIREKNDFLLKKIEDVRYKNENIDNQIYDIKRLYNLIFHNNFEGMFIVDLDDENLVEVNNCSLAIFRLEELDKNEIESFLIKEYNQLYAQIASRDQLDDGQRTFFRKRYDGTSFPAEVSFSYFNFDDSNCCLVIIRELTERFESEKMLLQAERIAAIGSVAGGVAHEFNNLHTIISGNIELLLKRFDLKGDEIALLDEALSISGNISKKINQVLEFSKQEKYFPKPILLDKHIESIFGIIQTQCVNNGITIIKHLEPGVYIKAIPGNITQVIMNMILFSIYDLFGCSVSELNITLKRRKGFAVLIIEDTGMPFEIEKIQVRNELKRDGVDDREEMQDLIISGLGWKVSEMIAAENGGKLEVKYIDNKNRFILTLPTEEDG